ncbi:uncharacterized protein BXZ73DRAFT_101798 [Epithele typhae]|uniref:uncharacterized protein n=1 Tax=Epithele typhae TaxID=378194 RepID=UPI002008EB83|nr:uncharacterized protein BXZ73DRAFT_101798 [Epithele typhae]KAH9930423.1 hypothetical protein BXZ73DRAFT_101798 [Epithele typhae]
MHNSCPAVPTVNLSRNKRQGQAGLNAWQAISSLLTTGNEAFAVTGTMDRDAITAFIASHIPSEGRVAPGAASGPASAPFRSDAANGSQVLRSVKKGEKWDADTFREHIQDVVNMIQSVMAPQEGQGSLSAVDAKTRDLFPFVVCRCRHNLLARVNDGGKMWGLATHPMTYIHEQLETSATRGSIPDQTFVLLPNALRSTFEREEIPPAQPWAKLFKYSVDTIQTTLEELVARSEVKAKRRKTETLEERKTRVLEALKKVSDLYDAMQLLKRLLDSKVLEFLLTPAIQRKLGEMRKGISTARCSRVEALVMEASGRKSEIGGDVEEEEAFLDDGDGDDDCLARYLKSLLVPLDIVTAIVFLPTPSHPPRVSAIYVDDGPLEPLDARPFVDDVLKVIQDVLQEKKINVPAAELQKALDTAVGKVNEASVHAEAKLMARALSAHAAKDAPLEGHGTSAETLDLMKSVFKDDTIAMGVSQKCCYCCHLLAQLIAERQSDRVQFVLPGTRSAVLPWYPPDGLPIDVLKRMRDELYDAVRERVADATFVPGSTQTIPLHLDFDLPEQGDASWLSAD